MNEETFGHLKAMELASQGVALEQRGGIYESWTPLHNLTHNMITFYDYMTYRVIENPYRKDQGFKEGDIVMMSDDDEIFIPCEYGKYVEASDSNHWSKPLGHYDSTTFKFARPLTAEEYKRVKVKD